MTASRFESLLVRLRQRAEDAPETRLYTFVDDDGAVDGTLEAATLCMAADRLATQLRAAGLKRGDRVLLVYLPGLDFVRALVGCLVAGLLPVPVFPPPPFQPGPEGKMLLHVAEDARAAALLSTRPFVEACLGDTAAVWPALPWICTDEAPEPDGQPWVEVTAETVAFLQYTSGSTGNPKGVCITHGNLMDQLSMYREELHFGADARLVFWVPPYHDLGLISGILAVLAGHGQAIMMSPLSFLRRPALWAEVMVVFRATHIAGPNFAFDLLVRKTTIEQRAAWDLSSLQVVLSGGESIRPATVRRFLTAFIASGLSPQAWCSAYGLAEHTVGVTVGGRRLISVDPVLLDQGRIEVIGESDNLTAAPLVGTVGLMSCGSPRAGVYLKIVDPQTAQALGPGEVGEIWVDSASKAAGYYGRLAESAAAFEAPLEGRSWLRTGDLGVLHAGELFVCGRLKDRVIVGGRKIHPQDVEESLREVHPKIRPGCTVVFAADPGEGGLVEGLVVLAELSTSATIEERVEVETAIRDAVRRHHRLACAAVVLGAPGMVLKTTSGKLRRRACAEAWRAGCLEGRFSPAASPEPPPQPGGMLALLRDLLGQVLGRSPAGLPADRPLGELGVSSLQLVDFTERLEQSLGRPVPSTLPFDAPTLGEMATWLSGQSPQSLAPVEREPGDSLCIVGIGCHFPGGVTDLSSLEELLFSGRDVVEEVPASRWNLDAWFDPVPGRSGKISSRWGAWIHGIEEFEPAFFDITLAEAPTVDPQERLLLESTWEALEQVGLRRSDLSGSRTGVFVGISGSDYALRLLQEPGNIDGHGLMGTAHSAIAARLSYWLGLRGPNMAIDTACSSSLVALHQACQAIQAGDCDMALAAGVNVVLAPEGGVALSRLGVLSPTGKCNSFSAKADGYVRADGAAVVVVERLADAHRHGHPVLALICGTAVNQDGRRSSFTAPNGQGQQGVLRAALASAGLRPDQVDAVECHGTGTALGDPVEVGALAAVFGEGRSRPLWIGSAKGSLGHTEAAAGLAGVAKALVALRTGTLPASLHALPLNPRIPWGEIPIQVATAPVSGLNIIGVSSFGLTGTNAHVLLQRPPVAAELSVNAARPAELLVLSAASPEALSAGAAELLRKLPEHIGDLTWTAATTRTALPFRLAVVARDVPELADKLQKIRPVRRCRAELPVAWLYNGEGSPRLGMGSELATTWPVFRAALSDVWAACDAHLPSPLRDVMWGRDPVRLQEPIYAQPAGLGLAWALTALWRSWGVQPSWVAGYSAGEIPAALAAGVLGLEDAARLVCRRALRFQDRAGEGLTYHIRASQATVRAELLPYGPLLRVLAVHGPRSVLVGGEAEAAAALANKMLSRGIATRRILGRTGIPAARLEGDGTDLACNLTDIHFQAPLLPFVSSLHGQPTEAVTTAAYWGRQLEGTVDMDAVVRNLDAAGARCFLEIGPGTTLCSLVPGILNGPQSLCLPSLKGEGEENAEVLETLGAWFSAGGAVDWGGVFPSGGRRVPLPTTVWQRQRYWVAPARPSTVSEDRPRSGVPRLQSSTEVTAVLLDLLRTLTGRQPEPRTPLVDLGMDSLMGLELRTRLDAALGVQLPLSLIWQDLCVEELSDLLREGRNEVRPATHGLIVPLSVQRPGRPIFCLPPVHGGVHVYQPLAAALSVPVWGLRAPGLEPGEVPQVELVTMAADYLALVREVVPTGPLRLIGYSFGAAVAQVMATLDDVELLILVDGAAPVDFPVAERTVLHFLGEAFGLPEVESRGAMVDLIGAQQLFPEAELFPQLARMEGVLRAHLRAWSGHRPQFWPGTAWLLRSAEGPPGGPALPDLGWKTHLGGLHVLELGGHHRAAVATAVEAIGRILETR